MTRNGLIERALTDGGGILFASEAAKRGISREALRLAAKSGVLERVGYGVYIASGTLPDECFILQQKYNKAVFSHETAAYFLGYTTRDPLRFTVTVPSRYNSTSLIRTGVKPYYTEKIDSTDFEDVTTPFGHKIVCFNIEKTICDLCSPRFAGDKDITVEVIEEYARSSKKDIAKLMSYATTNKIEQAIRRIYGGIGVNTSKQLNDRTKNIAKRTGVDAQILQKRYFMERFLARLSFSRYNRKFIIKGGMLISALVGYSARSTMDIDITIKNPPLQKEAIDAAVQEIAEADLDDNIAFSFVKSESIREESEYDCFRIARNVTFDKIRESIKIDITTGDIITPGEVSFGFCTIHEKKTISLYSYNLETVLAEKVETILARGILNTRMRGYYECFVF
jgi:predicted nucleotidyltransferase component of viral defense system